ncbi:hypothetical protein [Minwuia sp.]|uniref:hypothetical protein n=1 Tax=Minwuia sp. TaxID=2493630 RepID=UPI003A917E1C
MTILIHPATPALTTGDLTEGERLFLWCTRRWVGAMFRKVSPTEEILPALRAHMLEGAASDIDDLMSALAAHARRTIDVRIRSATELSRDEMLLCRTFTAAGDGHQDLAATLMSEMMFGSGLGTVLPVLESITAAFAVSGLDQSPAVVTRPARQPHGRVPGRSHILRLQSL